MLNNYLQVYTLSVVFIGQFNPVIIQPFWLAHKKLIREQEAQDAKVEIIHEEIVKFDIGWAKVEITKERFELKTSQEPYFEPVKDLAISIFEILKETPISALGINHVKYYAFPDEKSYYNFGDKLAPLSIWSDVMNDPRMFFLEIIEQKRKDGLSGHYRVRVRPSDIKLATPFGVMANFNDHFNISKDKDETGREGEMIKILGTTLKTSMARASEIAEEVWSKTK